MSEPQRSIRPWRRRKRARQQQVDNIRQRRLELDHNLARVNTSLDREFRIVPQQPKSTLTNVIAGTLLALTTLLLRRQRQRQDAKISVRPTQEPEEGGLLSRWLRYLAWQVFSWTGRERPQP